MLVFFAKWVLTTDILSVNIVVINNNFWVERLFMYYIHNNSYSYLLYPKKFDTQENKDAFGNNVDMLHYYVNTGVPFSDDMPEPVIVSQAEIDKYGLDALVANLQRKFKYDYDIVVVKVPQDYLRMEPTFVKYENESTLNYLRNGHTLPMMARYALNGQMRDMIVSDYVESVYLHYPDCRRIINDNWVPISNRSAGLVYTDLQKRLLKLNIQNSETLRKDESRRRYMISNNLDTSSMCHKANSDLQFRNNYGYSVDFIKYLQDKYGTVGRKLPCAMTKDRINILLHLEELRQDKIDRCAFIGR